MNADYRFIIPQASKKDIQTRCTGGSFAVESVASLVQNSHAQKALSDNDSFWGVWSPSGAEKVARKLQAKIWLYSCITKECVYDQTKLVVIKEQYREIEANQHFYQHTTTVGFRIHACEGYAPRARARWRLGSNTSNRTAFMANTPPASKRFETICKTGWMRWPTVVSMAPLALRTARSSWPKSAPS